MISTRDAKRIPLTPALAVMLAMLISGVTLDFFGKNIAWPGFIAITLFYGITFYFGTIAAVVRKADNTDDVLLAGRAMPLFVAVCTMSATWIDGGYVNGTAEYTYSQGLAWVQAPWGYAISLILGGLFFARKMRHYGFRTMLDPFEQRFGKKNAALLFLPALTGEIFWTSAILTALGATFGTIMGLDFPIAVILSSVVVILYTMYGGLWAVAITSVFQLFILFAGLFLVLPFALSHVGGLEAVIQKYQSSKGSLGNCLPPWNGWAHPDWGNYYWSWWDSALLLMLGGIPWQVYFQRVLSAKNEDTAVRLSVLAGIVCLLAAIPPVIIGMIGTVFPWPSIGLPSPQEGTLILPYVMRYLTNPVVAIVGLAAVAAAIMSSVDSSVLSVSSMATWNIYRPLVNPNMDSKTIAKILKRTIIVVGTVATIIALGVKSVYMLWYLCSDLVYCILFPQLVTALFDKKANKYGCTAGILVSLILRLGGGEPTLHFPALLPYPMIDPATGAVLFPFKTLAMICGLLTIVVVSRLTQKICPATELRQCEG